MINKIIFKFVSSKILNSSTKLYTFRVCTVIKVLAKTSFRTQI